MLKKLVALTLAALMLVNPMTAFAVSWGDVVTELAVRNKVHSFDDGAVEVSADDEGNVLVVGKDGFIADFYHSPEFKSYTFTGTLSFGGEKFEVYVKKNDDGTTNNVLVEMGSDTAIHANNITLKADDGNTLEMGGDAFHAYFGGDQPVNVLIDENVTVTAADINFSSGDSTDMTVTINGDINNLDTTYERMEHQHDENGEPMYDENGDPVLVQATVPGGVNFHVGQNASANVTLNGKIETEDVTIGTNEAGEMTVTNNGQILAQEQVGIYGNDGTTGKIDVTNNGEISVNLDTSDDIYEEDVDDNYIGGVMIGRWNSSGETTFTNTESGVVNGSVTGWLDNTSEGAGTTITNKGEIIGDVGAWGQSGEGAIELDNQGTIGGYLGTFTQEDTSTTVTNSGTVEGEMFADNQGTLDMTVTNSGETNGLSVGNSGGANATVTNSGNVTGGETHIDVGSGTVTFENTGTIEGERFDLHAFDEGTAIGTNSGSIDVEWGYVGSSENGNSSFTNESDGYVHTDENFDLAAGNWPGDENYPGFNPENSSTVSFVNNGEVVTEGSFAGNLQENGSITLENTETGTMTAVNEGIHVGINYNGQGSVSVNNAGTVNSEWFNVGSATTGEASITNTGTVNGYMGAYADGAWDDDGNMISANVDGVVSVTNHGTVTDGMGSYVNGGGTGNVVNTGDVTNGVSGSAEGEGSISVDNSGTAGDIWVDVSGETTGTLENTGDAVYGGGHASGNANLTVNNEGTVESMDVVAGGNATMSGTNSGTVGYIGTGTYGEATGSFVNNGFVEDLGAWAEEGGQMSATNNAEIGFKYTGFAFGDGQVTITNTETGTVGDSVQDYDVPDGVWGNAEGNGSVTVINDGTINGELGGQTTEESSVSITNSENATTDTMWVNPYGGELQVEDKGEVKGKVSIGIGTGTSEVLGEATVSSLLQQVAASMGMDLSKYEVEVFTVNEEGEQTARYSVAENGSVKLEEVLIEEETGGYDDPRFWTEERIRHDKEEERKAAEIGGVFGSPYWLKQLYLGYMSLNLRLFDGEEQLLFKESVSWVPYTGKLGEKVLTLNAKIEDTANLTMRLDGAVIDKLEQAGIVTIKIVDGAGNLFMEYKVEDLKGAREMYGLTAKEYIVVGAADADVMKIAEDGTLSPIEGEAEPAEEVAEEPKAEAEEAAAEENTAA